MPTLTAPRLADSLLPPAKMSLTYAERLCADIPANRFGHQPRGKVNHPAFNMGHLSIYPNRLLTILGRPELVVEKPGWDLLFKAGVECVDDDGRYPGKDEIVAHYVDRYAAAMEALPGVAEERFAQENPMEGRMREILPTIGAVATFMLTCHPMMHLGQISTWRRMMGMGSAM
jgi:hypothetical protein